MQNQKTLSRTITVPNIEGIDQSVFENCGLVNKY